MKITICSSAFFVKEAYGIKKMLEKKKYKVFIYPQEVEVSKKTINVAKYYKMRKNKLTQELLKIKKQLLKEHIKRIEISDAILVLNFDKDGTNGYIGGNSFLEMVIAYYLNKKIFVWKRPTKSLSYYEEIMALDPIIIEKDLEKIK